MRCLGILFIISLSLPSIIAQEGEKQAAGNPWPVMNEEVRPWTRWWWMGNAVNEAELVRLMEEYASKGFGGVEITPIYGVKGEEENYIEFLSPEWMKMLRATVRAAGRNHMKVDMNTGTGWPFGGPQITSEYAAKRLKFYSFENAGYDSVAALKEYFDQREETLLALSGVNETGQRINFLEQSGAPEKQETASWTVYAASQLNTNQLVKRAAPGGEGLVFNHFSRDATTHYLDRFDTAMDHTDPGIRSFFNDSYELSDASSTSGLFEVFQRWKGYDLSLYLKELAGGGDKEITGRIKFDYRDVLGRMILENFTGTWSAWAHGHGALTRNQAHGSPANLIDLYSAVDIPEVETFNATYFPFLDEYLASSIVKYTESNRLFKKFASSAAHLNGGRLVSCETFTWLNEHFNTPLYQCKPEIDNLFVQGINHIFPHGTAYSPGEADWPGWLFYASVHMEPNNPQWDDVAAMNRYIARCQSILQAGEHTNNLLVYWSPDEYNHQTDGLEQGLALHTSDSWIHMPGIDRLYDKGYQFDFISDRIIERSEVNGGMIDTGGGTPYKAIVVPSLKRIRLVTFQKLLQLADDGATIVLSSVPELVTGFKDYQERQEELARLAGSIPFADYMGIKRASYGEGWICLGEADKVLSILGISRETMADDHIRSISRSTAHGYYYFIANQEKERVDRRVTFQHGAEHALFMNPMNGEVTVAESTTSGSSARVHVVLEPGASMIIWFTGEDVSGFRRHPYYIEEQHYELSNRWSLNPLEGVNELPGDTVLPELLYWSSLPQAAFQHFAGTCAYVSSFFLESTDADNYLLRFGSVEASARVFINGKKAGVLWCYPFELEVGPLLEAGQNEIRVEVSNLGANGIRYLDQMGVSWKKFNDINFVNLEYRPFDASGWDVLPSGLEGKIDLIRLKSGNPL